MTSTAVTVIEGGNSLADLAARINAEHEASAKAIKRGLKHAIACGRLLLEAKAQLRHGAWLPWLRDHCGVPERTAQRYTELAAYAADSKSDKLADLALEGSATAVTTQVSPQEAAQAGDWELITQRVLDGPFNAGHFKIDELGHRWIKTKLLHHLKIHWIAVWCCDVVDETEDNRPAWRLCRWDQLWETLEALVPLAKSGLGGKKTSDAPTNQPIKFDAESFTSMGEMRAVTALVEMEAIWLLGGVIAEIKHARRSATKNTSKSGTRHTST